MKPNKETYQSFILSELERGTERKQVLAKFVKKWAVSSRTFDRQWKIAQSRHLENQQARQRALAEVYTQTDIERLNKAILTKDEALEILTKTAKGDERKVGKRIIAPSYSEITAAIKTMSELQGWNAPEEKDVKISGGVNGMENYSFEELYMLKYGKKPSADGSGE